MKNIWLIMCAAFTLTLLAGCKGDEPVVNPPVEQEPTSLVLEQSVVDVMADGGSFEVNYTLTGAVEGAELKVVAEYDWVRNIDATAEGVITFDVPVSYEPTERSCRVELIYPGVYPNPTFTVKQEVGKEHSIKFNLVNAAATTITMDVIPQDKEMPYVFILGNGKYFEDSDLMYDDEALWASDLEIFESFGGAFGGDASTGAKAFMYSGDLMSHQFTGVTPGYTYVAYAYGFDAENLKPLTEITRLKITTTSVNDYTLHFDFKVEVDGPNVILDVAPQGYDGYFYYGVFWAKDVAGATAEELRGYCEAEWENNKAYYSSFFDNTEQGLHFIFNELAFRGPQHLEVELDANTEFVLWAFGMDGEALMNTTPEFYNFKTGNVKASENKFTLSTPELHPRKATVKVETTNDDTYVATLVAADRFANNTDDEIMQYVLSNFTVQYASGTMSDTATGLTPATEYELLVFGAKAGAPTTGLSRLKFKTPDVVYADLDFSLTIGEYYDGSEVAKLNPNYASYEGTVIVPITASVDADAVAFYFNAMNALDFPYYEYETLIEGLVAEGAVDELTSYYAFEFNEPYVFFGVAEDADGNFTKVWSSKDTTFKKENCAPAEEFFADAKALGARRAVKSQYGLLSVE